MTGTGVAISTTGDEHRLEFLETSVNAWRRLLPLDSPVFVTVDGTTEDAKRAYWAVEQMGVHVYRVGRPRFPGDMDSGHRLGVAVNKNTGIELLMSAGKPYPNIEHLFLCDDDTWPKDVDALDMFVSGPVAHAGLAWGRWRHPVLHYSDGAPYVSWSWPRGALLYMRRPVVVAVGGMIEEFGAGGHEHVEYSRRIHQARLTPREYVSPYQNYEDTRRGPHTGAGFHWHAEDMPLPGEPLGNLRARRRALTSLRRPENYQQHIDSIMAARDGNTAFVPFRATDNRRASATLYPSH